MTLPPVFDVYREAIDAEIRSILSEQRLPLYDMMRYHLGWIDQRGRPVEGFGGKSLRSTLCLLAAEATGTDVQKALPAAAAVELLHNFTLIQDDVQDGDTERRHRPTVWSIWGRPQALNAATALHVLANLTLSRLRNRGVTLEKRDRAQCLLHETCLSVVEGQYLDISFEARPDVNVGDYLDMIDRKTAALVACALEMGALLGTDDESCVAGFRSFGRNLGLAFQIRDDILGIWGNESQTGKPVAADIRRRKKSLPIVYALQSSEENTKTQLMTIYETDGINDSKVGTVLSLLNDLQARVYAQRLAENYRDQALAEIDNMVLSPSAVTRLHEVTHFLVERES